VSGRGFERCVFTVVLVAVITVFGLAVGPRLTLDNTLNGHDCAWFFLQAKKLAENQSYVIEADSWTDPFQPLYIHPGLPIILSLFLRIVGAAYENLYLAKIFFYCLQFISLAGIFYLCVVMTGPVTALLLTLMTVLVPGVLIYFASINSDVFFLGVASGLLGLLYRVYQDDRASAWRWLFLGMGFGCLPWIRYPGIAWVLAACAWLFMVAAVRRAGKAWLHFLCFSVGAGILVIAEMIFLDGLMPEFMTHYADITVNTSPAQLGMGPVTKDPLAKFARASVLLLDELGRKVLFGTGIKGGPPSRAWAISIAFFWLLGLWSRRRSGAAGLMICFVFLTQIPLIVSGAIHNPRHFYATFILVWIPAVWGMDYVFRRLLFRNEGSLLPPAIRNAILVIVVLIFTGRAVYLAVPYYHYGPLHKLTEDLEDLRSMCRWVMGSGYDRRETVLACSDFWGPIELLSGLKTVSSYRLKKPDDIFNLTVNGMKNKRVLILFMTSWGRYHNNFDSWFKQYRRYFKGVKTIGGAHLYELDYGTYTANLAEKLPFEYVHEEWPKPWPEQGPENVSDGTKQSGSPE